MYWPITTSPLCVPAEGSPAVSQQGHRRTIDWGAVLFLQADPHSCFLLLLSSTLTRTHPPPPGLVIILHPSLPSVYLSPSPCSSLSASLCPFVFFCLCVSLLSEDRLQARFRAAFAKINNIILIQTDIKRHRANTPFLCRLIISPCFSNAIHFLSFGPFNLRFRKLLWAPPGQRV